MSFAFSALLDELTTFQTLMRVHCCQGSGTNGPHAAPQLLHLTAPMMYRPLYFMIRGTTFLR